MKSCLICDDHAILREALSHTVATRWPNCIIHHAIDYPSAWEAAQQPLDMCLTDLVMPGSEPLAGVAHLQQLQPQMPIIVLTGSHDNGQMVALLAMGISGFVPKSSTGRVIEAAIALVLAGGRYLPPELMAMVKPVVNDNSLAPAALLTRQQRTVLGELAKGLSNKEIAVTLGVAPSTIKFHVDSLLERLNARSRAELVKKGGELGLL
jgi:DNA-binding NarL/FixJ family response regulator